MLPMAKKTAETASPARNFTLTTAERVQAAAIGPPAWARRRKRIEELQGIIVTLARGGRTRDANKKLAELVKLIEAHNTYYPMEANLPFDPITSRVMEGGEPWKPLPRPTLESLLDAADGVSKDATLTWSDEPDALSVEIERAGWTLAIRLDRTSLALTRNDDLIASVSTPTIDDVLVVEQGLEITRQRGGSVTFEIDASRKALEELATELVRRLRALRAPRSPYR